MEGWLRSILVAAVILSARLGVHGAPDTVSADEASVGDLFQAYAAKREECLRMLQDCVAECRENIKDDLDAQDDCVRDCHRRAQKKMRQEGPEVDQETKKQFLSSLMNPQSDYWMEKEQAARATANASTHASGLAQPLRLEGCINRMILKK
jgi:hypothetical protein